MNPATLVGTSGVRITAAALLAVTVTATVSYANGLLPRTGATLTLLIVSAIVTFMALVHTAKPVYDAWMRFAETLHGIVVTVLFGAIYLLIVPVFAALVWPFDLLRLRKRDADTFWIAKRSVGAELKQFERMG